MWAGIKGLSLSEEEKKNIQKAGVSGLILFKRNIQSLPQLFDLCREIHSLNPAPLIIMDREGGSVDRLKHLASCPPWPAPSKMAPFCSSKEIEKTAFYMSQEMKALGISINFAPCVDVPAVSNPLLKGRLWGSSPEQISRNAQACLHGIQKAGLAGCAKHFPGHGGVEEDSHLCLPRDQRSFEELHNYDLFPFRMLVTSGVEMVMSAHILYSNVDPVMPATLSSFFLKKVLRDKMNFQGLVVSDDLDMKALYNWQENRQKYTVPEIMVQALRAGVDILLKCEPVNLWELSEEMQFVLSREKTAGLKREIELKLVRLEKFKKKPNAIKPVSSFKELEKIMADPKVHQWCKELNKRLF